MKKQVLAILLTLTLLLSLLPMGAMATEVETEETSQTEVSVVEEVTTEAEPETEEAAPETEPEPEEPEVPEEESASDVEDEATSEEVVPETESSTEDIAADAEDVSMEPEVDEALLVGAYEETAQTFLATGTASGSCGQNVTWNLDSNGNLIISGTGPMSDYSSDDPAPWYKIRLNIQYVVIKSGVTSIGSNAFCGCNRLTAISIPNGVTVISSSAFTSCNLQSVIIPFGVKQIEGCAFANCTVRSVTLPYTLETIAETAFVGCNNITDVYYVGDESDWNNLSIGRFNDPLLKATKHHEQDIPSICSGNCGKDLMWAIGGETLTILGSGKMQSMDWGSESSIPWYGFRNHISKVVIRSGVTSISNFAFKDCHYMTDIEIPSTVTQIGINSFKNSGYFNDKNNWNRGVLYCGKWVLYADEDVVLGNYTFQAGTRIVDYAFEKCKNLTGITIPEGVTVLPYFTGCSKLSSITIPSSVKSIHNVTFEDCDNLKIVYYGGSKAAWNNVEGKDYLANVLICYNGVLDNVQISSTKAHSTGNILYWKAIPGVSLYQVFRRTPGQPFQYLRCASGLGVKDETAKVGVTYIYAVKAVNGNCRSADYSNQVTLTRLSNTPANVRITNTNAHKTGNILYWNSVSGAKFYQIFRRTSGQSFEWIANTGGAAYKDETANPGVTYIYAIKAHNGSVKSAAYSNTVAMTRPRG